mgnify:CR=1 FL=1
MRASYVALVTLVVILACTAMAQGEPLVLVENGQPAASIVLAAEPTRVAQFAAAELQYHIQKMTGATLPILKDDNAAPKTAVLVGESARTRALGLKSDDFSPQEYLVGFRPGALVLVGRDADTREEMLTYLRVLVDQRAAGRSL